MDHFGKSKYFLKISQEEKYFRDKQSEYKYTIDFVNSLAKVISLSKTCEKYIPVGKIIGKSNKFENKRQSFTKNRISFSKENSMSNANEDRKKPSTRKNSKKQSNYLNYKKQINTSRNPVLGNSSSLKTYFYSSRSGVGESNQQEVYQSTQDISSCQAERQTHEIRCPKPSIRKNCYDSNQSNFLMLNDISMSGLKRPIEDHKSSIANNYSVMTDNFVHSDEQLDSNYNSERNDNLQLPLSKFKYANKNFTKTAKLPISKSVKNMHDKDLRRLGSENTQIMNSPRMYKQPSTTKNISLMPSKGPNLALSSCSQLKYGFQGKLFPS